MYADITQRIRLLMKKQATHHADYGFGAAVYEIIESLINSGGSLGVTYHD